MREDEWMNMAMQAAGTQVVLDALVELRKEMARNFLDESFLIEAKDRKAIPE